MRPELEKSLREIKKYFYGRTSISFQYKNDIKKEFEEWFNDSFQESAFSRSKPKTPCVCPRIYWRRA